MNSGNNEADGVVSLESRRAQKTCAHGRIRIEPDHRLVFCKDCRLPLAPFDVLLMMATNKFKAGDVRWDDDGSWA